MSTTEERLAKIEAQLKKLHRLCNKIHTHQVDPDGEKAAERSKKSWFNQPQKLSDELKSFLKVSKDTQLSSSEVTKLISAYVRENNLKNPDKKTEILLDSKLKKLLKPPKDAVITHLNIQKYIQQHYVKDE